MEYEIFELTSSSWLCCWQETCSWHSCRWCHACCRWRCWSDRSLLGWSWLSDLVNRRSQDSLPRTCKLSCIASRPVQFLQQQRTLFEVGSRENYLSRKYFITPNSSTCFCQFPNFAQRRIIFATSPDVWQRRWNFATFLWWLAKDGCANNLWQEVRHGFKHHQEHCCVLIVGGGYRVEW